MLNLVIGVALAVAVLSGALLRLLRAQGGVPGQGGPPAHQGPPSDSEIRILLANAYLGDLPGALRPPAPRPDVFSGRGYLQQAVYREKYLPLLLHGQAVRGLCVAYDLDSEPEGVDVTYEYAWLDHLGRLRRVQGKDSYDPMHAGLSHGRGTIVVASDASLRKGRALTVVYAAEPGVHVVYEALCIEREANAA
jgi:hypothetical protein